MKMNPNRMQMNKGFYQMPNSVFNFGMTAYELGVYSYLVSCAGQNEYCWPSIKTIAAKCGCGTTTARNAVHTLEQNGFIQIVPTIQMRADGKSRQANNRYYILPMPNLMGETTPPPLYEQKKRN